MNLAADPLSLGFGSALTTRGECPRRYETLPRWTRPLASPQLREHQLMRGALAAVSNSGREANLTRGRSSLRPRSSS